MATKATKGANGVGRFTIDVVISNNRDQIKAEDGLLPKEKVRRMTIKGVIDSGAARLVLPSALVKQLGLSLSDKVKVKYADGRTCTRHTADNVHIEIQGRSGVFTAVVEPKRTTALIGAIVLEDLDFLVDCLHQRIVPRDPRFVISEIESQ